MPSEERPERERSAAEEREIARRRDELIAAAKGPPTGGPGSGARIAALGAPFGIAILLCLFAGPGAWFGARVPARGGARGRRGRLLFALSRAGGREPAAGRGGAEVRRWAL